MSCDEHNGPFPTEAGKTLASVYANDPSTTGALLQSIIERDGAVIVRGLVSQELCERIRRDLKPQFDSDRVDESGFFPTTTKRAHGILAYSDATAELLVNPLFQSVANGMLTSRYTYWEGQGKKSVSAKPQIASIVGFRVEPGGTQQALHRDDSDYHTRNCDMPVMLGCVTALTKTTKENGATIVIPKSHLWGPDRMPLNEEAIPAELEVGDATVFVGNVYHAGGANVTKDDARETIGMFLCKGTLRQEENSYLEVPPELAKKRGLSPQVLRLLGYGIAPPALGLYKYQDPMRVIFGVEDEETVRK
ncbi:phytanoyl-CoA dioxygenase family protein [Metarhizium guizhouense ARSEF 977]|uniref:Phytanoyl-CoA dioxygenase family protein n=1 Tax=Metarhizium guizhouense (strain ARSEF 977) TaxID=1276136 RepID=A0A0B4GV41_METGA|nr:phytanoyl-CoA dioxygenase family protein [Metarhizium guizhouense ARSEF 977]